jgi:fatty-acid desaturase
LNTHTPALARPAATEPRAVMVRYLIPIAAVHVLALAVVIPAIFSWTAVVSCLVGVHLFGQAITIGYHRLLAHRSFSTHRWFEHLLVLGALCCLEDSPARWIATHRMHHAHSDEEEDPHSPLVAFAWGHLWWLFVRNRDLHHRSSYERYARDVLSDPFYMWIEKHPWSPLWFYAAHAVLVAAASFGVALLWGTVTDAALFAAGMVAWAVFLRTVLVWHITWSVNSLTHLFGYRNHETGENSRNNWLVALVACGEGWHNNHHADPARCSVSNRWWEIDVSHLEIRALSAVGVTWDIVPARAERVARARQARATVTEVTDTRPSCPA